METTMAAARLLSDAVQIKIKGRMKVRVMMAWKMDEYGKNGK